MNQVSVIVGLVCLKSILYHDKLNAFLHEMDLLPDEMGSFLLEMGSFLLGMGSFCLKWDRSYLEWVHFV